MSATVIRGAGPELDDIQGLVRYGYGHLTEASFLLLRIKDSNCARAWLAQAPIMAASEVNPPTQRVPSVNSLPQTALQVAFTSEGLRALDIAAEVCEAFSTEFVDGMASDSARARRLGDVGESDPSYWQWGTGERAPHVVALLYAASGCLVAWQQEIEAQCAVAFTRIACLSTSDKQGTEPFGFADGISQPKIDWERCRPACDLDQLTYRNDSCLGEFLLGYPNEYGLYTPRPLIDLRSDADAASLPRAEDSPDEADLGRNGCYLVMRQLEQDVQGFWRELDRHAAADPDLRERLAAAMVGRQKSGQPLIVEPQAGQGSRQNSTPQDIENDFTYETDPRGQRCPLGAHIRRANPRNADLPPGSPGIFSRLARMLGIDAAAGEQDLIASTRFHRLLRRGRKYGATISTAQGVNGSAPSSETGLHFICLVANIKRQFEFVQSAWMMGSKFAGLNGESDPLLGRRQALLGGSPTDNFSLPQVDGPDRRLRGLPQFVTGLGGAYFFMPGIRALRYIATARRRGVAMSPTVLGSNTSRPVPPANTGSAILNWISDTSLRLLQLERRIDPWIRPAFDAVLRDPLARLITAIINWQRPNEGLKIAEERIAPDEEAMLQSIIDTFKKQMSGLWKPGGFERGGNTKTHGIVRAEFIVHDSLPTRFRHGMFAHPQTYRAWVRFSGPGPYVTPDIDDVGFMSISIKLMGVPGPKLMDEEKFTQDMFGVSPPTFVTPDTRANAQLQTESLKNASLFYFLNFHRPHVLDFIMQGLWMKTQSSPFEAPYFSCVPYLLGEGQAMQYSVWPKSDKKTPIPRLPLRPADDYLRHAMVAALDQGDVEFDIRLQLQADPRVFRWPPCAFQSRSSIRRRRSRSRGAYHSTHGTALPSTVLSAIKAALAAACITSYPSFGTK